ncbi:response regulator [bacterium]|nr:response regulator [bacterium]
MTLSGENKPFILIVDDNPTNLDVLIEILQSEYQLSVAKSGKKALEFVKRNPPELILLDIVMPEMDGFDVCRILKQSDTSKEIPIIFITAHSDRENIVRGFELGGADYLNKPFIPMEVKIRIKNQIALYRHSRKGCPG